MSTELPSAAIAGRLTEALDALEGRVEPANAWQRGWVLAGLGRYAAAFQALEAAMEGSPDVRGAALGTSAAIYRQLNLHERALDDDESALAMTAIQPVTRAALLVGLVADGVGLEERAEALGRRLRDATDAVVATGHPRQHIRLGWVSGEVALVSGDIPEAVGMFSLALDGARALNAVRHEAKSLVFLAAAYAANMQVRAAEEIAELAAQRAALCEALPLRWPAALILAETAQAGGHAERAAAHREAAAVFLSRTMEGLDPEVAETARERPPASWLLDPS